MGMPEPFTPVIAVDIDGFQVEVDAGNKVRYTLESRWTHPLSEEDEDAIVRLVKELVRLYNANAMKKYRKTHPETAKAPRKPRARFNGKHGWDSERKNAADAGLVAGKLYAIEDADVDRYRSKVKVRGLWHNSVLFSITVQRLLKCFPDAFSRNYSVGVTGAAGRDKSRAGKVPLDSESSAAK